MNYIKDAIRRKITLDKRKMFIYRKITEARSASRYYFSSQNKICIFDDFFSVFSPPVFGILRLLLKIEIFKIFIVKRGYIQLPDLTLKNIKMNNIVTCSVKSYNIKCCKSGFQNSF